MELNTEINKVFGQEMARLFSESISEEEMKAKAEEIWKEINKKEVRWGTRYDSDLEKYIKNVMLEKMHMRIRAILEEPENEEIFEQRARDMIKKARDIAEEGIVQQLAQNMIGRTTSTWNDYGHIVNQVLNQMEIKNSNERNY